MNINCIVITGNNERLSKLIQEIAFEEGYEWFLSNEKIVHYLEKGALFFHEDKNITYSDASYARESSKYSDKILEDFTLENFRKALRGEYNFDSPSIFINGNKVQFYPEYIMVGCTGVSNEKVEEIYNHIQEQD